MRAPERGGTSPRTKAGAVVAKVPSTKSKPGYRPPPSKPAVAASKAIRDPAPSLQEIMAQSGSTDPSDPYNWRGIAAALAAQQAEGPSASPAYVPPSGGTPNMSPSPASPTPPPPTPVFETPVSYIAPSIVEPPKGVTRGAEGAVGAPAGETFSTFGGGPTFGMFERMRKQRSPRQGLSVTPEMLQAAARARLG